MIRIALLVTSDIIADQRIHRTATTLVSVGYRVIAIGRRLRNSPKSFSTPYKVKLLRLPFQRGPLFYASYNIWAFFSLIFRDVELIHANDLDTLLAARLVGLIRRIPIVYDSHELFTEVPELIHKEKTRRFWIWLEKMLVKGLKYCSTVSNGVAAELQKRYNTHFEVIRNLPFRNEVDIQNSPSDNNTILYQGALNIGRGLEKLIEAMQWIQNAKLTIVGEGDIERKLKEQCQNLNLCEKIHFTGRVPLEELNQITRNSTIGVSIEEDLGLNYRYALPNKLFDYIQAGLPVLTSNLPEMKSIVDDYGVGETIESECSAILLAKKLQHMLNDKLKMEDWRQRSLSAGSILCWENEKDKLIKIVEKSISKKTNTKPS